MPIYTFGNATPMAPTVASMEMPPEWRVQTFGTGLSTYQFVDPTAWPEGSSWFQHAAEFNAREIRRVHRAQQRRMYIGVALVAGATGYYFLKRN